MEPMERTGPESVVFRVHRAGSQPECLPTAYKPQLITRRSLVQVQPPQPNKKGTRKGAFLFGSNWLPMEASRLRAGRPLRSNVVGTCGSPTNAPSLTAKRGIQREIHSVPIAHSKTDETVVSSVFSFCPEPLLTHTLTQTRKGPERFRKRPRGHSPSHRLPAVGLWWSHGRRCPG